MACVMATSALPRTALHMATGRASCIAAAGCTRTSLSLRCSLARFPCASCRLCASPLRHCAVARDLPACTVLPYPFLSTRPFRGHLAVRFPRAFNATTMSLSAASTASAQLLCSTSRPGSHTRTCRHGTGISSGSCPPAYSPVGTFLSLCPWAAPCCYCWRRSNPCHWHSQRVRKHPNRALRQQGGCEEPPG